MRNLSVLWLGSVQQLTGTLTTRKRNGIYFLRLILMTSWMSFYKQTFLKHKCTHPENSNYSLYRDNYGQGLPRTERQLVGDLYQYSSGCYQWETCNKRYNKSWGVTTINHTHIQAKFRDSNPLCPNCGWTWREPTWTRGECPSSTQKSPCSSRGFEPEASWLWGCTTQPPSNNKSPDFNHSSNICFRLRGRQHKTK